jgi:MerR family transcriptional regulator/heat shock protein HspR
MPERDEPVFVISIAAQICEMHPQTLREYERHGLVRPKRIGQNRLYSQRDIERIQQIQRFTQQMGVNLAGVEIILDLLDRVEQIQIEAEHQINDVRAMMEQQIDLMRQDMAQQQAQHESSRRLVPVPRGDAPIAPVSRDKDEMERG